MRKGRIKILIVVLVAACLERTYMVRCIRRSSHRRSCSGSSCSRGGGRRGRKAALTVNSRSRSSDQQYLVLVLPVP